MSVLVDTNILIHSANPWDPNHDRSVRATTALHRVGESLLITPQVAAEFWNVATKAPERNGLGMSTSEAARELANIEALFEIVPESHAVYLAWRRIVVDHRISGVGVHDARLVAAMEVYGIPAILTFNRADFARFPEVEVIEPS